MIRKASIPLFLFFIAVLSGNLLANATWIGKMGIGFFYKEYGFLKTWWKGAMVIFILLMVVYGIAAWAHKLAKKATANIIHTISLLVATCGLLYSYLDFRNDFSHRLLGENFHLGVYLFWLGWMVIAIYFLIKKQTPSSSEPDI